MPQSDPYAPRPLPFGIPQYPGYCQWGGYPSVNPWIVPYAVQSQAQDYQQLAIPQSDPWAPYQHGTGSSEPVNYGGNPRI